MRIQEDGERERKRKVKRCFRDVLVTFDDLIIPSLYRDTWRDSP
jgi:hypothetical protein